MIRSIRALRSLCVFMLMGSLCISMTEEEELQWALGQSLKQTSDDLTYKQLVKPEDIVLFDSCADTIKLEKKALQKGIFDFSVQQQKLVDLVKDYDQKSIFFHDWDLDKTSVGIGFKSKDRNKQYVLKQLQGLYQGYPGLHKLYGNDAGVLCGFYSSYFLFHLLQQHDVNNELKKNLNDRDQFNIFFDEALKKLPVEIASLELYEDQLQNPLSVVDAKLKFVSKDLDYKTIIVSMPSEEIGFMGYNVVSLDDVITPFLISNNPKKVLGIILQIGISQGGLVGHWIAATLRINNQNGVSMSIVDPKNVDRLAPKDLVVNKFFDYVVELHKKNVPAKKDSIASLSELLKLLKEKLVNLLKHVQKLTMPR